MRVISEGLAKITRPAIEAAWKRRGNGMRIILRDKEARGLALVVNPTGMRWECCYRPRGVNPITGQRWGNRTISLGTPASLSPEEARVAAARIKGEFLAGGDPLAERRAKEVARRAKRIEEAERAAEAAFTFGKLVDAWQAAREGSRRASYLAVATAALRRHFARWLDRPASGITLAQAVCELDRIKREVGPVAANRCLSYARAAYGWAEKRQMLTVNPLRNIETPSREKSRDRVLTIEEAGAIWRATGILAGTYRDFVRVLVLTLQRRDEVAGMQWSEIAPDFTTWTIPAARAKNGRAHVVHLSEPVRAILTALPRHPDCPTVFAAESRKPVSAFSLAKRRIETALATEGAALAPWTMHDFRRAGVTWLASAGFPPHICDKLLNQVTGVISGVAAVYQRAEFLPERARALDAWAAAILAAAEGKAEPANVVALRA
jgi:integrase